MRKLMYVALALAMGIATAACNRKAANELSSDMLKTYDDLVASSERMVTETQQMMQEHESLIVQAQDSLQNVDSRFDSTMLTRVIERHQSLIQLHEEMMQGYKTLQQYYKDVKNQHTSGAMSMERIQQERAELEKDHQRILWEYERMQAEHKQSEKENTGYLQNPNSFYRKPPPPDTTMMDSMYLNRGMDTMQNRTTPPTDTMNRRNKRQ